ncbi:MAG TPA: VWA domain-containing protein [Bryobacteraceae bacterium]|nr:VWA domain-containing protein [Bryobacteraceae bacterium]
MNGALVAIALGLAFQAPTFRSSARLVQVNVIVRDKNGPVANLTKEDFGLTDRGKPRTISIFSVATARPTANVSPLPPNTFSNRSQNSGSSPGNVTIVLLDALNTLSYGAWFHDDAGPTHFEDQALAYGKNQLMRFVKNLDPQDRVAIYALGKSLRVLCDFTNDPSQLQKVLAQYRDSSITLAEVAEPPSSHTSSAELNAAIDPSNQKMAALANGGRSGLTMAALLAIANHTAGIPGRKNLVWLTASLPATGPAIARLLSRANIAIYPVDARGLVASFNPHFRPIGLETMQELADETGGRAFYNNNDISGAIRKAVDDSDVSYTLGFYLNSGSLDGQFHELKIRVDRPGLEIRYPSGYFAVNDEATASQRQRRIHSALASPLESSAIHILARIDRLERTLKVSGSIDLRDLQLPETGTQRKGAVEIFLIEQDALGNVLDQTHSRLNLVLNAEQYAAYLKSGVFFRQDIDPKEEAATLRILVGDPASTTIGSLIIPVSRVK